MLKHDSLGNFQRNRLDALGITEAILKKAVETGVRSYNKATSFHPNTYAGSAAWGDTVATIREELKRQGWSLVDHRGLSLACNKKHGISLVVTSGCRLTGVKGGRGPSSKNNKGNATKDFVDVNYDLFQTDNSEEHYQVLKNETWVFLYHYDLFNKEVRYELSLPLELSQHGHFSSWAKRFVFKPISLKDEVEDIVEEKSNFNDEVDFDIFKKA